MYLTMVLAACGDGTPIPITITSPSPPAFVVVRNDTDTEWVTPTQIDDRTFELVASGPYRVTWGCDGAFVSTIDQLGRTPTEGSEIDLGCLRRDETVTMLATMKQPGTLSLGKFAYPTSVPDRRLPVESAPGPQNLIAFSDERVLVIRDLIAAPGLEVPVDLGSGTALSTTALTVDNLESGEVTKATVSIESRSTLSILYDGDPAVTRFAPDEVFGAEQTIEISASRGATSRYAIGHNAGAVVLPAPVRNLAFEQGALDLAATWDSDLVGEVILGTFAIERATNRFWTYQLRASAAYMTGRADAAVLDLESLPDLPPQLVFDPLTVEVTRQLTVDSGTAGVRGTELSGSRPSVRR